MSTSAPPELPGLIAASVWMKSSKRLMPRWLRPERADDAARDGVAETERIADREHDVADLQRVDGRRSVIARQVVAIDLEHGEVGFGIGAAHLGERPLAAVGQHDLDVVGAVDHVMVGEHVAVGLTR